MWQYNSKTKNLARHNRKQRIATRQEGILWHTFLKKCPVNFCRQYRIENYIVDFYAPEAKLAIELDGSQHYEEENAEYEKNRTEVIESKGITILRFSNPDIDKHLKQTTEHIVVVLEKILGKKII